MEPNTIPVEQEDIVLRGQAEFLIVGQEHIIVIEYAEISYVDCADNMRWIVDSITCKSKVKLQWLN